MVPQRHRQADGQITYDSNTALALHASHGNKTFAKKPLSIFTSCLMVLQTFCDIFANVLFYM